MNDLIDDQELQRLLDGTLSAEDRALLMQYADDHPVNWRRISLAFMEEQMLRNELSRFIENPLPPTELVRTEDDHGAAIGPFFRVFSQAAVLCLLFGTAVWIGRISVVEESPAIVGNTAQENAADDYTILLTPQQQPESEQPPSRDMVQLASTSTDDAVEQMFAPIFDQESQGIFRDYGYTVNEEPVIYVVQGPAGEQYLVPRRNVSFVANSD